MDAHLNLLHYKTTKSTCLLRWKVLLERAAHSTIFRSNQRCIQLSWTSKVKAEFNSADTMIMLIYCYAMRSDNINTLVRKGLEWCLFTGTLSFLRAT